MRLTPEAAARLRTLLAEHPEDPVIRITLRDLDESRLIFSLTLEAAPQPDDRVVTAEDLTIALAPGAAARVDDVVLDYRPAEGFRFLHADPLPPDGAPTR